jgi:hypothetical protein
MKRGVIFRDALIQEIIATGIHRIHNPRRSTLSPVKVGVCALSARGIVGLVFFNKTINCERYLQIILGHFFPELTEEERLYS